MKKYLKQAMFKDPKESAAEDVTQGAPETPREESDTPAETPAADGDTKPAGE